MRTVVDHIVLLRARADVTDGEVQRLIDGVNSLKAIPGVITVTVGSTFVEEWMPERRDGFTHSLSCRLESKDVKIYQDHPLHVKVKTECIAHILASPPVAVDYESAVVIGDGQQLG